MKRTLAVLWLLACATHLHAASYPDRPIRLLVPFAPGGTNDIIARLVAAKLQEALRQPVVVDNRAGGGGVIGIDLAAKATPDGYTLLMANLNLATNPALVAKLPYDATKDFIGVSLLATSPVVLAVTPTLPIKTVGELIAYAQAHPGKLTYATSGIGSTTHIPMELLVAMTGIKMVAVHYKGGGPALLDLVAGRVSPAFTTILAVMPHIHAQRVRALAVSTSKRSSVLPDVPTIAEAGVPGYAFTGWWGMVVPARTPRSIIASLNSELGRILQAKDVREKLIGQGAEPEHTSPEAFTALVRSETRKWGKVIRDANIQAR